MWVLLLLHALLPSSLPSHLVDKDHSPLPANLLSAYQPNKKERSKTNAKKHPSKRRANPNKGEYNQQNVAVQRNPRRTCSNHVCCTLPSPWFFSCFAFRRNRNLTPSRRSLSGESQRLTITALIPKVRWCKRASLLMQGEQVAGLGSLLRFGCRGKSTGTSTS